ncbi:MAG TPA: transposase family protein, partial [Saprospiraceae bacterium]|nr:transposase family protein [Saprospiraceae bacterium]
SGLSFYEECLFFVLFQLKNGLCYDNLGLIFGTDASNAHRNFERNLLTLERALERRGVSSEAQLQDPSRVQGVF